jgi:hypothetical protein
VNARTNVNSIQHLDFPPVARQFEWRLLVDPANICISAKYASSSAAILPDTFTLQQKARAKDVNHLSPVSKGRGALIIGYGFCLVHGLLSHLLQKSIVTHRCHH